MTDEVPTPDQKLEDAAESPEPQETVEMLGQTDVEAPVLEEQVAEPAAANDASAADELAAPDDASTANEPAPADEADEGLRLEIGSEAEPIDIGPRPAGLIRGRLDEHGVAIGTGRRKTAVARVRISDGDGKLTVNGREFTEYFPLERDQQMIHAPLKATDSLGKLNVWVRVSGGGPTGQTGAVVLGIARALQAKNPDLHTKLSEGGYLTRDGRMVERKKYGLRKARRAFQFSKR